MTQSTTIEPADDPANWTLADLPDGGEAFTLRFTAEELVQMDQVLKGARARDITPENAQDDLFRWPAVALRMNYVLAELRAGRGVVVMAGLPLDRWSKQDAALMYWGLGTELGAGVSQSAKGDRLGHVRDMSAVDSNARAYQNKHELNPHTDHTELVGLMCLRDAKSGGETPITSALAVHDEILRTHPHLMPLLYRGWRYHRRGEQQPGEPAITPYRIPVFSRHEGKVSCRLIRPYIHAAAEELGQPLSADENQALDLVQALSQDPRFCLGLRLTPGSLVFFNNYTVIHGRRPFVDHEEPDRKRHLLRLWLLPDAFRPTVPEIEIYSTKGGIQRREGGMAETYDWGVGGR